MSQDGRLAGNIGLSGPSALAAFLEMSEGVCTACFKYPMWLQICSYFGYACLKGGPVFIFIFAEIFNWTVMELHSRVQVCHAPDFYTE